jgi:NAD+ diphosphatase
MDIPTPYSGGLLDRAAHLREDHDYLARAASGPDARTVLLWRGQVLVTEEEALYVPLTGAPDLFLGLADGAPVFARDLSAQDAPPDVQGGVFRDLRGLASFLPALDATVLATARGMFHWHATHRFCPACGGDLVPTRAGWVLQCSACGQEQFPRTDAAVIMLVQRGGKVLLGQAQKFPPERNIYSTLAGFVEPGEALEDAVRREVYEEVGVRVGAVSYFASQPWPFPASLMLGFFAEAVSEEIVLDPGEMRDARWFTREEIVAHKDFGFNLPPADSIARRLIAAWLAA